MRYELWQAVLHGVHSAFDGHLRDGAGGLDERPAQLDGPVALQAARVPVAEPYPVVHIEPHPGFFRVTYPDWPAFGNTEPERIAFYLAEPDVDPEHITAADLARAHHVPVIIADSLGFPLWDAGYVALRVSYAFPVIEPWHIVSD